MKLNPAEQKQAAKAFVTRWQAAEGNEQSESGKYWLELAELLGIAQPTHEFDFERRVHGRRVDVFYQKMGILIENKSRGVDLDKRYERGKDEGGAARLVTPYEQAKWYADNMLHSISPRWIIVCNFDEIRIHDLDNPNPGSTYVSIPLEELPDKLYLLSFFTDHSKSRLVVEQELSVEAGGYVGVLYSAFAEQYKNLETDPHEQRSLNILIVRLVFLLYAEDAGLLQDHQAFCKYMKTIPESQMRAALIELFKVLDTKIEERDDYIDENLMAFPYINGGLFADEDIVIPNFTMQLKTDLLLNASQGFDWHEISPTIFGAVFESTLNPETRRSGGMHYTSIENIHKVIDPLFLDELTQELESIENSRESVNNRRVMLHDFQDKLTKIKIFDPACGSGNFLTESYLALRKLENRVIENLLDMDGAIKNQMAATWEEEDLNPIKVKISQFYGIEINDFAVSVAKTALWIAEEQMMGDTQQITKKKIDFFPLESNASVQKGNAIRKDWNKVLSANECTYIIGNPPFVGHQWRTKEQQEDMAIAFSDLSKHGKLDYVCAWYAVAARYMKGTEIKSVFVSTNSICQGESVGILWRYLMKQGLSIFLAYRSFHWESEASDKAGVTVVIVGFSHGKQARQILFNEEGIPSYVNKGINGYLIAAPMVFIENRGNPVNSNAPKMTKGSQPTDGGFLIMSDEEKRSFQRKYPDLDYLIKPYIGADEFIKNKTRWCFWLKDIPPIEYSFVPEIKERLQKVREVRQKSPTKSVRDYAEHPELFTQIRQPKNSYLVIPEVSGEKRRYIPIGYLDEGVVANNRLRFIPTDSMYLFGLLCSGFHNAWMRVVSGRLETRYCYSPAVYNSFVFPNPTVEQQASIESCAQVVLDARNNYPDKSLADLYDPDQMPSDLLAAHKDLDAAVEAAYGVEFNGDEEKIVAHLFKLYAAATGGSY